MKQQPSPAPASRPLPSLAHILSREIALRLTQADNLYIQAGWGPTEPRPNTCDRIAAIVRDTIDSICSISPSGCLDVRKAGDPYRLERGTGPSAFDH
jgi:hypothetical protein